LSPVPEIGSVWPPKNIETLNAWEIPFLNTLILLSSGVSVTWAHHSIIAGSQRNTLTALAITIGLAVFFTLLQLFEYNSSSFSIYDGIYGSTFFMATGFHGFHVFIGTCFLFVCFFRVLFYHFTKQHHFGFEAAAWYWHFVDVVWLFLFVSIYWWGNLLMFMSFYSPLEQFEIIPIVPVKFFFLDFSFSNSSVLLLISFLFIFFIVNVISFSGNGFIVPNRYQIIFENLYRFILDIVQENLGKTGQSFFPFFFFPFYFFAFL